LGILLVNLMDDTPAERPDSTGRPRNRPAFLRWSIALLVSGGLLASLFIAQRLDPRALVSMIGAIWLPGLAVFILVSVLALGLASGRYWLLLEGRVPVWPLVLVTLVRNLFVHLVPARAGAAASYLYLVTARLGLPAEAAFASMALAFVLETLGLGLLLMVAVLVVGVLPLPTAVVVGGSLALLAASGIALVVLAPTFQLAAALAARLPPRLAWVRPPLGATAETIRRLETRRVLAPALGLSVLLRLAKYGAYYYLLQALLMGQAAPRADLDFFRVFLSVLGAELVASLPVPTIASLGPYEVAGTLGFVYWLGLPPELATLVATAFHAVAQVYDDGLGLLALGWIMRPRFRA
jgi:hypothetical protein